MSTLRERERPKHVKYASVDPLYPSTAVPLAAKTHTRRRTERDLPCAHPHLAKALLTPPLTPASSIRTSGSSRDSALEPRCAGPDHAVQTNEESTSDQLKIILDPDQHPTRIVLLDNLGSALPLSALESSVVDAVLGATSAASNPSTPILKSLSALSNGRSACLVFFDVRCAKALVHYVTAGLAASWFQNVGQESGIVDASFLTAEEAVDFIDTLGPGSSLNADQLEGSVYLTVQKHTKIENDTSNEKGTNTSNHDINTPMLINLLKSFGSLRRFNFDVQAGEENNSSDPGEHKQTGEKIVVYHLEYHDLRDAEKAIEELDGRTMFGVNLDFGIANRHARSVNTTTIEAVETEEGEESTTPSIVLAPAGVQSNMRKRFRFAGDEGGEDANSDTGGHTTNTSDGVEPVVARDSLLEVGPGPGGSNTGTPSPTFFYTSSTPSAVTGAGYLSDASSQPKDGLGEENATLESHVASSGHPFRNANARLPGEVAPKSMHSFGGSIPNWDGEPVYHPQQQIQIPEIPGTSTTPSMTSSTTSLTSSLSQTTNATLSPCYGTSPDGVCHYCPSRGPHPAHASQIGYGATYPGYGLSPPPLPPLPAAAQTSAAALATAGMYYPPPTPMQLPGQGSGQGPAMSMQVGGGGYEYLDSQMQVGGSGSGVGVVMSPQQAHPQVGMGGAWAPGYHHDPSMASSGGMVPLPMGMGLPGVGVGMNMMNMGLAMPVSMAPPPPPPLPSYMGYVQREDANALVGGGVAVAPDGRTYLYPHYPQHGHGLPPNYAHSISHGPGHFVPQAHGVGIGTGAGGDAGLNPTNSGPDSSPHASSGMKGRRASGANQLSSMVGTPARSTRPPSSTARRSGSSRLHHSHTQQRQQNLEFEHAHRPSASPSPPAVGIHESPSLGSSPPPPLLQVSDRNQVNDRNQLNIARIEEGLDTRTTVMIKNIPNKMSDRDLIVFIEKVCPRRIDFFYLRMDFQNGCNVGYAFVNFIHVQDLLRFAKARLGIKWNMFSSEKVLQMSYANYQGKEALVEKFKNSAIMDERESWRPRIFYSSSQNQGLPEPFPPPTHMRRKERSSYNRGALFVPGVAHDVNGHEQRVESGGRGNNSLGGLSSRGPLHRQLGHGQLDSGNGHWHGSRYYADAGGPHHWRPGGTVGVEHDSGEVSRGDELGSMYGKRFG